MLLQSNTASDRLQLPVIDEDRKRVGKSFHAVLGRCLDSGGEWDGDGSG